MISICARFPAHVYITCQCVCQQSSVFTSGDLTLSARRLCFSLHFFSPVRCWPFCPVVLWDATMLSPVRFWRFLKIVLSETPFYCEIIDVLYVALILAKCILWMFSLSVPSLFIFLKCLVMSKSFHFWWGPMYQIFLWLLLSSPQETLAYPQAMEVLTFIKKSF